MAKLVLCARPNVASFCGGSSIRRLFSSRLTGIYVATNSSYQTLPPLGLSLGLNRGIELLLAPIGTISSFKSQRRRRRSLSSISIRASSTHHHHVNDSGSIDSPLIRSMESKIKEQLNAESVIVKDAYGDGRHVSIDVISSVFEGESAVSRQRMVYKAIWEELQNTVHAVDQMTTKTPSEAATSK